MGDLKLFSVLLTDLKSQAQALLEAARDFSACFDREETRVDREGEVSSLRRLHQAIVEQMQLLEAREASASSGDNYVRLVGSLVGLVTTAIMAKGDRLSAVADYLCRSSSDKQPFTQVMVYVGPKGLPDDVGAISVSERARETGLPQPETMSRLRDDGYLLFTREAFSLLIDRSVDEVRAGKLRLPIPRDVLLRIPASSRLEPEVKIVSLD